MRLAATTRRDRETLEADVCIVGAGPAGLTLAQALADRGASCVLLESGDGGRLSESQELNAGTSLGDPYPDLRQSRFRGIGGTAAIWNTYLAGEPYAKYVPLDPVDLEPRESLGNPGWPVQYPALLPWLRRAQEICELGPFDYRASAWQSGSAAPFPVGDSGLRLTAYQLGAAARFTRAMPANLAKHPGVRLVEGATVIGLDLGGERVTGARWASSSGMTGSVRSGLVVLAAGAIENARLLLALERSAGIEVGEGGWLGRGFMEHPVDRTLRLIPRDPAMTAADGFFAPRRTPFGAVTGRIGLEPDLLRSERLCNATIRLVYDDEPPVLTSPGLRRIARRLVPLLSVRRAIGGLMRRLPRPSSPRPDGVQVWLDLEQAPHRENRILLSAEVDALGVPRAALDWRWRREDEDRRQAVRSALAAAIARAGAGRLVTAADLPLETAVHHHAGTTRMSEDPRDGVVTSDGRVHRLENLYVIGASVFPSAGVANPTLTVVALAVRLADHLRPERRFPPPGGPTGAQS